VKENVCDLVSLFLCCCRFSVNKGYVKGIEREIMRIERGKGIRGKGKGEISCSCDFFPGKPSAFAVIFVQWLNYSARGGGSLQARGLKGRSSSLKGQEQRWGSRPPSGVFEHSRHSAWLLWHLNSV